MMKLFLGIQLDIYFKTKNYDNLFKMVTRKTQVR
mgnify:CR=1 FL=1|jgi:hypothetical protein